MPLCIDILQSEMLRICTMKWKQKLYSTAWIKAIHWMEISFCVQQCAWVKFSSILHPDFISRFSGV